MLKTCSRIRTNYSYISKHAANYSTQPAIKESTSYNEQLTEFQKISNIQQKSKIKQPQKPPFVKNLLLGKFDTDILTYPELKNEQLDGLNKTVQQAERLLEQPEIKECTQVSNQFLKKLAAGKLLGLQASQLMGGLELTSTELCRMGEAFAEINLKNTLINNENLVVQALVKFGSEHLKRKYLQKLIDGESLAAFCVIEPSQVGVDGLKKNAEKSPGGKTWVLNGEKKIQLNGSSADLYVVVANSGNIIKDEIREQQFSVFVVERDFGGITTTKHKTLDGIELTNIVFDNTQIPAENVIGEEDNGEFILSNIYPEYRLSTGPICLALMKRLINKITEHFVNISSETKLLYETDAVRIKLGELVTSLYAVESMIYLTSGLIDNYENQDTELETTIVKVFASEQAFQSTSTCLDLIGPDVLINDHWCSKLHQEALTQVVLNDDNDNLKILVALFGLRYAGQEIGEFVTKVRNPFFYSLFAFKRMWANRRQQNDDPSLNLNLHYFLHPSCMGASKKLEYCVLRLQYATEALLTRHGLEVVNKHAELRRLADAVMDIYAMTACLGRASRSYCIGLQHGDYEMNLAIAFVNDATERVKININRLVNGPYFANDDHYRNVAKRLFKFKQYFAVHPLTRNF